MVKVKTVAKLNSNTYNYYNKVNVRIPNQINSQTKLGSACHVFADKKNKRAKSTQYF